ncbi:cytochrome P450, partial [Ramicandelaber brevisporus]
HADILQMFMDAVDPETGARLDNDSLVAEASVMLVAGSDTAAFTLMWTFDLLFQHPRVFRKLEAEILARFPSRDAVIAFKDAKELAYLDAVILESMRVRAVAGQLIPRVVPAGGRVLGGHFIPGGYGVGASLESVHRDPSVFDEPTLFKPERFVDGTADELAMRRQHVIPFSVGVRSCLGRQLALAEIYTAVPTLIRRFVIQPAEQPYPP